MPAAGCRSLFGELRLWWHLGVYSRMKQTWRLTLGEVDGEPSIILLNKRDGEWEIKGIIRLDIGVRLAG
jgi:hypothetical protein